MLTAHKQTVSARLNESEQEGLTSFLAEYQRQHKIEFSSIRSFLVHLSINGLSTPDNNKEVIEVEKINDAIVNYGIQNELSSESEPIAVVLHALKKEPTTVEVEKIIEKEVDKTVTVEVEKELSPNQFLVELNDNQLIFIKQVNANRMEQNKRRDIDDPETLTQTFLKAFFNKGNLYNWGGEFYTGLK